MWYRKIEDKGRLEKLAENSSALPAYYDTRKGRYVRLWKSKGRGSVYAYFKKRCRRDVRRRSKTLNYYDKRLSELWWRVW